MKKRFVLAITGTRADYGIYRPVFRAIQESKNLSLGLFVTGTHLRQEFGHTVDAIREDGFPIIPEIDSLAPADTSSAMAVSVGRTLIAAAEFFAKTRPDIVLVLGDRGEQLAGAIAAATMG